MRLSIGASRKIDDDRLGFLAREAWPSKKTATYRYCGKSVTMTHHTEDVAAFEELFVSGVYDLPSAWGDMMPAKKIVDLGGNVGMFGLYAAIHWPAAKLVAFEPDPANAAKYRRMIADNSIACEFVEKCAGAADGTVTFAVGKQAHSHITDDGSGIKLPVVDVFPYLANVDILKVDIEGGEWPILLDKRFESNTSKLLYLEYHRHMCPVADFRGLAVKTLESAGYEIHHIFYNERLGAGVLHARRG